MPESIAWQIPLAVRPPPDPARQMLAAQNVAGNQIDLQNAQLAQQVNAAMRNVFADPANLDPATGQLKPQALASVMAIDPRAGMAMQKMSTDNQIAQANLKGKQADLTIAGHQLIEDKVRAPSAIAYQRAIERGLSPQAATDVAQQVYSEGLKEATQSGLFSEQQVAQMPTNFDFQRVSSRSQAYLAYQEQQRKAKLEERRDTATEDYQRGSLGVQRENVDLRRQEIQLNRELLREPKYSAPVAVQIKGEDGKTVTREAQQDNNPRSPTYGRWVTADETHAPVGSPERVIKGAVPTEEGMLKPETLKTMAEQYLAGDKSVFQNLGRGAQGSANIVALRGEVAKQMAERGMTGADMATKMAEFSGLQAGERTLGTRTANIEMAVNEAKNMIPIALAASDAVDRTKFPTLNSLILAGEKGTGGEAVVKLTAATNSLVNAYSRAISPTGVPTVSDKDHAREILSSAYSKGQYRAAVELLMQEMNAAQQSPGQVRQGFREGYGGNAAPAAPPAWTPGAAAPPQQIFSPATKADYDALPAGAHYRKDGDPEGSYRVKK
jgi:hypothetical protein